MSSIQLTPWKLPQTVISNGQTTGNPWTSPNNLLLVDGDFAESNPGAGVASDIILGNYNFNLPQNAVVVGIEMQVIGKRGNQTSPVITLSPNLIDNTSGTDVVYPYISPFTGLTPSVTTTILGTPNYLFASSFTPNQINNAKLQLLANGDIYIDSVLMRVYYFIPGTPVPPASIAAGCADCDSDLQVPFMTLYENFLIGQTKFTLSPGSFTYADGTPVQPGDTGSCGGEIPFVFDEGRRRDQGGNFEESAVVIDDVNSPSWSVLPSGAIEVDLGTVNNRGLLPKTPYTHDANLMSNHDANSKVIISNSGKWSFKLLKKCHIGVLVSAPIAVYAAGTLIAKPVTKFNLIGAGQSTSQDLVDPEQVNITIPGAGGTTPPLVVSTTSGTSGNVQVSTLSADLEVSGLNRGAVVEISTEESKTVSSVTVGGVAATQEAVITDAPNNLRTEIWVCVNPPLGTQPVVVTLSGNAYLTIGAECLSGIDTATPVGSTQTASGSSTAPSLGLSTTYDYSLVIDGLTTAQAPILYTPGPGQGLNWSQVAVGTTRQGGSSVEAAGLQPDAITMSYSITQNTPWVYAAVEIKGITSSVASGITSINGDTTAAQTIAAGAGISVATVAGVTTITNSGGGGTGTALETTVSQTAHGLSVGNLIKVSGTNTFAVAQGDTAVNAETVGIVTTVVNVNSFKYVSSAVQLAIAPVGTPGSAVWLSPTVAGGMTATKPSTVGQVARALGTIIESGAKMYFDIAALAEVVGSGVGVGSLAKRMYLSIPVNSTGTYTFAHGLGVTPTYGLTQVYPDQGNQQVDSYGQTDFNSVQSCVYTVFTSSYITAVSTAQSFFFQTGGSTSSYGTLSADATNITATVSGSSSAGAYYIIIDLYI